MPPLECDYLVVGAGAMGIAFCDALLEQNRHLRVIIADRRAQPGGHWNDAYSFVRLHQPSCFYGVNSAKLEGDEDCASGELAELASGDEIRAYYDRVVRRLQRERMLDYMPSVSFSFVTPYKLTSILDSRLSWDVVVRQKIVDATYSCVQVPSMRQPPFPVHPRVSCIPINQLSRLTESSRRYVVVGSGKTGIDAVLWLLQRVNADCITWIMPRDAWLWNRSYFQPDTLANTFSLWIDTLCNSVTKQEWMHCLESEGFLLRLDPNTEPDAFRCATVTIEEFEKLQSVSEGIVRAGHVLEVQADKLILERGQVNIGSDTILVDCTADGLASRPVIPIWSSQRIVLQPVVLCQQVASAAMLGHMEASYPEEEAMKNKLFKPVPHPRTVHDSVIGFSGTMTNMIRWVASPRMLFYMLRSRTFMLSKSKFLSIALLATKLKMKIPKIVDVSTRMLEDERAKL